jgi:hypothetical protein
MPEDKKVSWNASQGLISEISNRRSYANTFFINGDMKKALKTLISIKDSVIQSLSPDERNFLSQMELKFNKVSFFLTRSSSYSFNKKTREGYLFAKELATTIYSQYNEKLMDSLNKYGYLIGEQSDSSRMKF